MRHIPSTTPPDEGGGSLDDDMAHIRHCPEQQRLSAFARVIDAADALAPEQRNLQLIALTDQIKHLHEDQRWEAFGRIFRASDTLDEVQLTALSEQIQHLKTDERLSKINDLLKKVGDLPIGHPALAEAIRHLAPEQELEAFGRLLGNMPNLESDIRDCPERHRWNVFDEAIKEADALAPEQRNARLTALAGQIRHLDINHRLTKFNVLFELTGKLPAGHPAALTEQIEHLTPEQRRDAFDRLLGDAHRGAHLETLAGQIRWLHEKDRLNGFDDIVRKIERTVAVEHSAAQFVILVKQIPHLPEKQLKRFEYILAKITGRPDAQQRVAHLKALIRQIESLPEDLRMDVFLRIAVGIRDLGKEQQLARESCIALLNELGGQVRWLSTEGYNDQLSAKQCIAQVVKDLNLREKPSPAPERNLDSANLPQHEQLQALNTAMPASIQFPPQQFAPSDALQAIRRLAALAGNSPTAAATEVMAQHRDGQHIGLRIARLMNTDPRSAETPLKAYLELVDALRASGHLTHEDVQSLLLPETKEERHLPISAAVASHWQSGVAQPFVRTLANATPESGREQVVCRLRLKQSDRHHRQIRMQYPADFYKQIKRGIEHLPAATRDTPALPLLAEHGLIPPQRALAKIAKKMPAAAPTAASTMSAMSEILTHINEVMPAVLMQQVQEQKQDAELEKARATYQANWQAAQHAQEACKSSPVAAMVAGLSCHLHAEGAVLRARKPQSIAQWEQARADRRRLEEQDRQTRDRALPSARTVLMRAGQLAALARSSPDAVGKKTLSYAIAPPAAGSAIEKASIPFLAAHGDHAVSQSHNALVPRSGPHAMVRLPPNTKYSRSTGEFSVPVKAIIHHEAVSGSLSGQIDSGVVVYIPPGRSNVAIPGTSTDRQPAHREIPTVAGIENTSQTIAVSLQQGQQQLGIGALWKNVVNRELHFNDRSGEKRITVSPPKAPVGPGK